MALVAADRRARLETPQLERAVKGARQHPAFVRGIGHAVDATPRARVALYRRGSRQTPQDHTAVLSGGQRGEAPSPDSHIIDCGCVAAAIRPPGHHRLPAHIRQPPLPTLHQERPHLPLRIDLFLQ